MKIIYARQPVVSWKNSTFLAGPTPRNKTTASWRPTALNLLKNLGFQGVVLCPEDKTWTPHVDYMPQVEWEKEGLEKCSTICFWVPRQLPEMPAFTTNIEFGRYVSIRPDSVIYGRPDWAEKCKYLDWFYETYSGRKPHITLEETLRETISLTNLV